MTAAVDLNDLGWMGFGPDGFLATNHPEFSWADYPVAGWIGDSLQTMPLGDRTDRELLDAAAAWERILAWAAGQQARAVAEFARRRPRDDEPDDSGRYAFPESTGGHPEIDDSAADELSLALSLDTAAAQRTVEFAHELATRLPGTLAGMCDGTVSAYKARILREQASELEPEQVHELESRVLEGAAAKTPAQFRRVVRREVTRIDSEALHRRMKTAVTERRVELFPLMDGMAELRCLLPGPDAVAGYAWLDQHARAAKASGDGRTMDQLRADGFVDLITARSTAVARKPLVRLLIPATTLAGGDAAGELAGYGPIDPHLARELAADGTWQRILTDPFTGSVMNVDSGRYVPPAALRAFVQTRDRTCRFPTCNQPAHRCEVDHTVRYPVADRPTRADNLGSLCRRHHRLKDQPGSTWKLRQDAKGRFIWTTPSGQIYRADPEPPFDRPPPAMTEPPRERKPESEITTDIKTETEIRTEAGAVEPSPPGDDPPPY